MNRDLSRRAAARREAAPFLVRYPWLGYGLAIVSALLFIALTFQVLQPNQALLAWDTVTARAIYDWAKQQPVPVVLFMRFWSAYGRDGTILMVVILTVVWARRGLRRLVWFVFVGVGGAELLFQISHNLINRPRPDYKDPFETLIGAGYPSGHMATNIVFGWMILYLLLPRIRSVRNRVLLVLAVTAAVAIIGFSRLFLGLHYPTDMFAGTLLGLGWGAFVFTFAENYFRRRDTK